MLPRYDRQQSYRWNYDHAPDWDKRIPEQTEVPSQWPGDWRYLGRQMTAPIGIAAGPLLNGRWVNYYSRLGFDYLTYKTVRNAPRACYEAPNLQPVKTAPITAPGETLPAQVTMDGNWAISFGMPSKPIPEWQADIGELNRQRPPNTFVSVSVVASPADGCSMQEVAEDYATCARHAADAGAEAIELNLSCPNVRSADGQIYLDARAATAVTGRTRELVPQLPLLIKIGFIETDDQVARLVDAVSSSVDAIVSINCISARVAQAGVLLFNGEPRGIGGPAIREASVRQVARIRSASELAKTPIDVIGCGGVRELCDVQSYLSAGATAVQIGTAAMLEPNIGLRLRAEANR